MRRVFQERAPAVAVLVLVGLALATLGAFVHTDDGCDVEQHCRACRIALAGLATGADARAQAPTPDPAREASSTEDAHVPRGEAPSSEANRGPPATA